MSNKNIWKFDYDFKGNYGVDEETKLKGKKRNEGMDKDEEEPITLEENKDIRLNELIGLSIDKTEYFNDYDFNLDDIAIKESDSDSSLDEYAIGTESSFERFLEEDDLYYKYRLGLDFLDDDQDDL